MTPNLQWHEEIYQGLRSCLNQSFPKRCNCCGKEYASLEEFISATEPLDDTTGLMEYARLKGEAIVGLFRNCACHSTLVALCENRRDSSPEGKAWRQRFEALLDGFAARGLDKETARTELHKLLHGQDSPLLTREYGLTPELFQGWFHPNAPKA